MKKTLFAFFAFASVCCSCMADGNPGRAIVPGAFYTPPRYQDASEATIDNLLVLELNDQVYYVKDLSLLEKLVESGQNMCFTKGYGMDGTISTFYEVLYRACNTDRSLLEDRAVKAGKKLEAKVQKLDRYVDSIVYKNNYKELFKQCLLNADTLRNVLSQTDINTHHHRMGNNIDACIKSVFVGCSDTLPAVPDGDCLSNMSDLDSVYAGRVFDFQDTNFINGSTSFSDKVFVFNGKVLVACEGPQAQFIIRPSFSGREECQGGEYKQVPGVGNLPNGLYLAMSGNPQPMEDKEAWGGYRIPLIASTTTQNYDRTNFYLHGTTKVEKRSSGGCISTGLAIDELVNKDWFKTEEVIPVIVSVPDRITRSEIEMCE